MAWNSSRCAVAPATSLRIPIRDQESSGYRFGMVTVVLSPSPVNVIATSVASHAAPVDVPR
jgi:hypothetical protein